MSISVFYLCNAVIVQAGFAGYRGSAAIPAGGQVPATGAAPGQGQGRHLLHRLSGTRQALVHPSHERKVRFHRRCGSASPPLKAKRIERLIEG
jgi:hypothetical protein